MSGLVLTELSNGEYFIELICAPAKQKAARWVNGKCIISNYIKFRLNQVPVTKWKLPTELKQPINVSL